MRKLNLPNIITITRILLVPLIVWLIISTQYQIAFFIFVVAGLTDALDGYLAKKYHWHSQLGAYLDPIADKILLVSVYLILGLSNHLPVWLVIAVVSRDLVIVGAFLLTWILNRTLEVRPLLISKINTTSQIILAALVLVNLGFNLQLITVINLMVFLTLVLTIMSAFLYLYSWFIKMSDFEKEKIN